MQTSSIDYSWDLRRKRSGHLEKQDKVAGEYGAIGTIEKSYELVSEDVEDQMIKGMKFSQIPILYLKCTRNNTKASLFRTDGSCVAVKTAGLEGFKNCRKGTTVAAQAVANRLITVALDNEIDTVRMVFNGLGPGRDAAYKVFELSNLNIVSLSDRTQAAEPWTKRPRKAKRI